MRTEFEVILPNRQTEAFDNLAAAIRYWDSATYLVPVAGEITVREFDVNGICRRDGNILHVQENGVVYLNPNLRLS